ncbi:hypothetical protein L226DRAFT_526885 [Lentinus tigrinus ALCF2SS1-7]|uniref:DUF6533 domain-containing protein n=1 Tax=Lentinus tigrinus ALCF2SS1-6 TaxID=1328759 RepID=A0A5C2S2X4_9APHY|nr:hypothetical protein L227DRAFT_565060 [Lentinus tigrinus ALCF2SS1-6]RPD69035.1 hypothetical protein L226DRAFT_526885 [Lentinus tigrinus ALCF2SS1-7]
MSYSYGHSALIRNPSRVVIQNYCIMASSALLWYDFGLTLTTEIQRVWHREFSFLSAAYICMRYSVLVDRATLILEILLRDADNKASSITSILTHMNDITYILGLLASAAIVIIRVYGISAKNWRWLPIVLPLNLVRPILYAIESARYYAVQGGPPFGCTYVYTMSEASLAHNSHEVFAAPETTAVTTISSTTMLASHGILVFVTMVKTFSIQRHTWRSRLRMPLTTLLLRDERSILVFNAFANFYATPSATIFLVWPYFYEILFSLNVIILSHFILDIRGLHCAPTGDRWTTSTLPVFAMPPMQFSLPTTGSSLPAQACPSPETEGNAPSSLPEDTLIALAEGDITEEDVDGAWLQRLDLGTVR